MSGIALVGCLMLGLAAGFLTGNFAAGILGGMGLGFVAMGIAMAFENRHTPCKGISGLMFVRCLTAGLAAGITLGKIVAKQEEI